MEVHRSGDGGTAGNNGDGAGHDENGDEDQRQENAGDRLFRPFQGEDDAAPDGGADHHEKEDEENALHSRKSQAVTSVAVQPTKKQIP